MSDYIAATTHVDATNHVLVFDSEGYYMVGDGEWQDITFTAVMKYSGGSIGIAPRVYDTNFYMFLNVHNEKSDDTGATEIGFASLDAQVTYETYNIAQTKIAPLVVGQNYTFKVEIKGVYYKIYLNDAVIFNVAYPGMSKGQVGVYATAGNSCSSIEVQSSFADGWTTNAANVKGGIADIRELENEDKYLYLSHLTGSIYAQQILSVSPGKKHTLSFNVNGAGTIQMIENNGAAPKTFNYVLPETGGWVREEYTEMISSDCTEVIVRFKVDSQSVMINDVQLEDKSFATAYIHNDSLTESKIRQNSIITYPSKDNINIDRGTISMWVKPSLDYTATTGYRTSLFEYGDSDALLIYHDGAGYLQFQYGAGTPVSIQSDLLKDSWYNIVATWTSNKIELYVNETRAELLDVSEQHGVSNVVRIGWSIDSNNHMFNGIIDETIVYSAALTQEEIDAARLSSTSIPNSDSMIMRATFNHAISNFNKSIIEAALIPNYGSPVLVEKTDGTAMRKVSFFDFFTGEYKTFNEETIEYDKDYDYIEISYYDKDVDQESFKINVVDADGVQHGGPYELRGKKVYLYLSENDKETLDGEYLTVTYQLEDSYTVDFNIGVPDAFRVTLGKHDGQPVKVTYEGNRFTDEKLATMVEMNPLLNPNHEGFLYVTRNNEKVTAFRTMATPSDLPANGGNESLIVVEPLDANGNYISHCKLDVSCEYGIIIPAYDVESIKLRDRAGRFLYRYNAPLLFFDKVKAYEVVDYINVIDVETGIGVQIPITLTTLREEYHTINDGDTLEKIAERYGATINDVALANDMTVTAARAYVIGNVGESIQIPINYSAREVQKAPIEIKHDTMIAYLTNMIIDHMDTPVELLPELGPLLDLNEDGIINIHDIEWLKDNRLTTVLEQKYTAVLGWSTAN